jgi:hypothetical protein
MFTGAHHWFLFSASWVHLHCNVFLVFEKYLSLTVLMSVDFSSLLFHWISLHCLLKRVLLLPAWGSLLAFSYIVCFAAPLSADWLNLLISHTFSPARYILEPLCRIKFNLGPLSPQIHLWRPWYYLKELCTQHTQLPLLML